MSTSVTSVVKHFPSAENGFTTTLASTVSSGATTVPLNSVAGYTNGEVAVFVVDPTNVTKKQTFTGTVDTAGVQLTAVKWTAGTNQDHTAGSTVVDYATATHISMMTKGILVEHNQDGTHSNVTATSVTATTGTFTSLNISGSATAEGYSALGATPDTVTNNGNRNYDLVFNSNDLTDTLSAGMRLKLVRTVAAPTQCADLESGSTHYFNKTSPAGTTFTDDFCAGAWVKLESYTSTDQTIISRYNGTSGWHLSINNVGQVNLAGYNAGSSNVSYVVSQQSVPLNKWVHVSAQLDMSAFTTTSTTSYVMFDGVDVPCQVSRAGTNPTALVQAGNIEVGARNAGTTPFDGKLAQVFYSSAKITQANIRTLISQGLTASLISTHSIVSAYSLSNSLNDLNTTSANNLTAQNSAAATNADSPFAGGSTAGTDEYAIVVKTAFSTNSTITVQIPEGYAIPTSGGISSITYSTHRVPYGFPANKNKWYISTEFIGAVPTVSITASTTTTVYPNNSAYLTTPVGDWIVGFKGWIESNTGSAMANYPVFGGLWNMTTSKLIGTTLRNQIGASTNYTGLMGTTETDVSNSAETKYTFAVGSGWTGSGQWYGGNVGGTSGPTPSYTIYAECAYL